MEFTMAANNAFIITITAIFIIMGLLAFQIFRDPHNNLSCWQFISSRGIDGRERADIDKLSKVVALFVLTGIVIMMAYKNVLSEGILLIYLGYCGGTAGWSAYLRSRSMFKLPSEEIIVRKKLSAPKKGRSKSSSSRSKSTRKRGKELMHG